MPVARRTFLAGLAGVACTAACRDLAAQVKRVASSCPFRLAILTDEIAADFDHACFVAAHDFGLNWVELRSLWGKNVAALTADQTEQAVKILAKYKLKVTMLDSPLFKADFPGAPLSHARLASRATPNGDATIKSQDALLERMIELTRTFDTGSLRCFDFWRLEDLKTYRAEIDEVLRRAAEQCDAQGLSLLLQNDPACNTTSGMEAAAVLAAVPSRNLLLNWDPANAAALEGDSPFPRQYDVLPKKRIGHLHCSNVRRTPGGTKNYEWQPVLSGAGDGGMIDWTAQFKALQRDGYRSAVSLETRWRGAPGPDANAILEASTRVSMKGMRDCLTGAGIKC